MKLVLALIFTLFVGVGVVWFFQKQGKESGEKALEGVDVLTGLKALDIKTRTIDPDLAVSKAKEVYREKLAEGTDFSNGLCLSEDLLGDTLWVADIAHDPRESIDDLSENQCSAFREGRAKHFVELDPQGNLIRVY